VYLYGKTEDNSTLVPREKRQVATGTKELGKANKLALLRYLEKGWVGGCQKGKKKF